MQLWKVATVVAFWAMAVAMLLVYIILDAKAMSNVQHMTISKASSDRLGYPGFFICPAHIPPAFRNFPAPGSSMSAKVNFEGATPAYVNTLDDLWDGYLVCPEPVTFVNPKDSDENVTCAHFSESPAKCGPECDHQQRCGLSKTTGAYNYWYSPQPADAEEAELLREMHLYGHEPDQPWTANRTSSSLIFTFKASGVLPYPVEVLPYYKDDGLEQPPTTWAEYTKAFSLNSGGKSSIRVGKYHHMQLEDSVQQLPVDVQDRFGRVTQDSKCASRVPQASVREIASYGNDIVTVIINFKTLSTTYSCYQAEFGVLEVIGMLGGSLAILGFVLYVGTYAYKFGKRYHARRFGNEFVDPSMDDEPLMFQERMI